ncbi:hypothetical protein G7054_g1571 [Neopestalotiopsis clavispora]|nr:hypothetical protein G7054_g1571 [Neopestalotiopsis clavispora]
MNKPGLSFGLNLTKKPGAKAQPAKPKPGGILGGGNDSDSEQDEPQPAAFAKSATKSKAGRARRPLRRPSPRSRKCPSSAAVRKRDALIAEEKKIAREREAEGEEFADKEKFVTEAYKQQQEENRRLEEEEKKREEEEARKNKGGGMTAFYKDLLNQGDQRHAEIMKAAEERAKNGPSQHEETPAEETTASAKDRAKELNAKGASIAINEDGEVVDKRELLRGGLNLGAKKKPDVRQEKRTEQREDRGFRPSFAGGGKNAMRERQSRMMEEQLEQALKRNLEVEEEERQQVERAAKSRKTETEISSAKERYLARKKAAEEAKKNSS